MKPALEPLELLDAKGSAWVERHLRRQIEDPAAELSQITGKKLKHEFKRLLAHLAPGDHLCDWGWEGTIGLEIPTRSAGAWRATARSFIPSVIRTADPC